jgi:hypothetical protein
MKEIKELSEVLHLYLGCEMMLIGGRRYYHLHALTLSVHRLPSVAIEQLELATQVVIPCLQNTSSTKDSGYFIRSAFERGLIIDADKV